MDIAQVLQRARDGEDRAWEELVARFGGLVWAIARGHRLGHAQAADVFQTTWLRLVEHLDSLREPERVGAWLATTARHESLRALRAEARELPSDDGLEVGDAAPSELDARLLRDERDAGIWRAFAALPARCQALLRLLVADPPPSYEEVGAALGMPIGSIGPTRARCLERLRDQLEPAGITAADAGS